MNPGLDYAASDRVHLRLIAKCTQAGELSYLAETTVAFTARAPQYSCRVGQLTYYPGTQQYTFAEETLSIPRPSVALTHFIGHPLSELQLHYRRPDLSTRRYVRCHLTLLVNVTATDNGAGRPSDPTVCVTFPEAALPVWAQTVRRWSGSLGTLL